MSSWWPLMGLISWCPIFKTSHSNPFDDRTPVDFIYGCSIFKWVTEAWLHRLSGRCSNICQATWPSEDDATCNSTDNGQKPPKWSVLNPDQNWAIPAANWNIQAKSMRLGPLMVVSKSEPFITKLSPSKLLLIWANTNKQTHTKMSFCSYI